MKKMFVLVIVLGLSLSACLPAAQPTATLAPVSELNLQATVEISVQQTLQALPSPTLAPSNTPVPATETQPVAETTSTETLPPTATLDSGTPVVNTTVTSVTSTKQTTGTPATATLAVTVNPAFSATVTETPHLQYYGTMPPYLAFSRITLNNKSKSEVYISLQCTTSEGYKTIIEYPVKVQVEANFPVGRYVYVAWVGGRQITGKFVLDNNQDRVINIFKDRLEIK